MSSIYCRCFLLCIFNFDGYRKSPEGALVIRLPLAVVLIPLLAFHYVRLSHHIAFCFDLERYIAVPAYHIDLLSGPDNGSAIEANIFDAAIFACLSPSFSCRERGRIVAAL